MNEAKFKELVNKIKSEYDQVKEVLLLDPTGNVIYKSEEFPIDEKETKGVLDSWKNTKSSLNFMGNRYVILKWDDIQLAAKNIGGKGNICGSITPEGDYFVAHIEDSQETLLLIEWSIMVNKLVWDKD